MTTFANIESKILELFRLYGIEIEILHPNAVVFHFQSNLDKNEYYRKIEECIDQFPEISYYIDTKDNCHVLSMEGLHISNIENKPHEINSQIKLPTKNKKRRKK